MTRRYTRQRDHGENAAALDEIMFPSGADEAAEHGWHHLLKNPVLSPLSPRSSNTLSVQRWEILG
jgi:hypothetical protein